MPFLSQRQIAESLRTKAEKDYKAQLRSALLNPALSAEQRRDLQARLSRVGQPRVYDADSPPVPGAIQLPPASAPSRPPSFDPDLLRRMKKGDLLKLAEEHGVPTTGTRADLIERLLSA